MKTAKAIIDVDDGKLKVRVGDEEVTFNVFDAMKHPEDKCLMMDVVDDDFLAEGPPLRKFDPLEVVLTEEVCRKQVSTPMPTLHTDVKGQEVKKSEELHLKDFPPPFDDGKPNGMKSDVKKNDGVTTPYVGHSLQPWPIEGGSSKKHFGGGLNIKGKKTSFLSCLKPP